MNDNERKQKIMRYAQLVFRRAGLEQRNMVLPTEEAVELETILFELNLTHEQVLEHASRSVISENEC